MNRFLSLLLLTLLSSCAYFVEKIDAPLVKDTYQKKVSDIPTYCKGEPSQLEFIGTNEETQKEYWKMTQKAAMKFDLIDHLVLWSLVQLQSRPDQSSPTSRLQLLLNENGKTSYFDFFSENHAHQFPYLYGLDWILKKYGKKTSLESYADILDKNLSKKLKIGKEFAAFLAREKDNIKKDPALNSLYLRGAEVLRENETLPVLNLKEVLALYRKEVKNQKVVVNSALTPYTTNAGHQADCNYDFNLYDNSIFLIDKTIPSSNLFGLAFGNSAFMASSSQKLTTIASLNSTSLFLGESKVRSSAVCVIDKADKKIWAFSNLSRDPGQHLFHLIRYGLSRSKNAHEVDMLIKHSRHLFLSEPVRLIIESNRSRPDQIENLLKLNLPIYNAENLGNIWAYTYMNGIPNFIIDDRNNGSFLCK